MRGGASLPQSGENGGSHALGREPRALQQASLLVRLGVAVGRAQAQQPRGSAAVEQLLGEKSAKSAHHAVLLHRHGKPRVGEKRNNVLVKRFYGTNGHHTAGKPPPAQQLGGGQRARRDGAAGGNRNVCRATERVIHKHATAPKLEISAG